MTSATLFEGVRLVVGDGRDPIDDACVLVEGETITYAGRLTGLAHTHPGQRVSLHGKTVMPALISAHGHVGYMDVASGVTDRRHYSRANVLDHLRRLAYYGVSTFQSLGTERDGVEISIRDEQRRGELPDTQLAELMTAGAGIIAPEATGPNGGPPFAADTLYEAGTEDEARAAVRDLASKRVDVVKIWVDDRDRAFTKLPPAVYRAAIDEARGHALDVIAHIFYLDDAKDVIRAGAKGIAHQPRDFPVDDELLSLILGHDVVACTTMGIEKSWHEEGAWLEDPSVGETVTAAVLKAWMAEIRATDPAYVRRVVADYAILERGLERYVEAGVTVVMSTDMGLMWHPPGFAEHRELEVMVQAGMSESEAIRSATQVPAAVLGLRDRGTLEAGKRADLLVLDADPQANILNTRRISDVYLRGERLDRAQMRSDWLGRG